jgi:hypothetical protein
MLIRDTEIQIGDAYTIQPGPYRVAWYKSYQTKDIMHDPDAVTALGKEFIDYLNRFFLDWRLEMRVECHVNKYRIGSPWKEIAHILILESDADAETVRSRRAKLSGGITKSSE